MYPSPSILLAMSVFAEEVTEDADGDVPRDNGGTASVAAVDAIDTASSSENTDREAEDPRLLLRAYIESMSVMYEIRGQPRPTIPTDDSVLGIKVASQTAVQTEEEVVESQVARLVSSQLS